MLYFPPCVLASPWACAEYALVALFCGLTRSAKRSITSVLLEAFEKPWLCHISTTEALPKADF